MFKDNIFIFPYIFNTFYKVLLRLYAVKHVVNPKYCIIIIQLFKLFFNKMPEYRIINKYATNVQFSL